MAEALHGNFLLPRYDTALYYPYPKTDEIKKSIPRNKRG